MGAFEELKIRGFDHIEFAVSNLESAQALYSRLGFERMGHREIRSRGLRSVLMAQGELFVLLSQSVDSSDSVFQFVKKHGDGVINVAFRCDDATSTLELTSQRGARVSAVPQTSESDFGTVTEAVIEACGDVTHSFVSREGDMFLEGFESSFSTDRRGKGLRKIDHITTNVEKGKLDAWATFYADVFGLRNTRFFDIHTEKSGLYSKVMESPDSTIKMPVNEPGGSNSGKDQIQEYIDVNHGPGVQHIALLTENIVTSLEELRTTGLPFLTVPHTYYESLPKRVPHFTENLEDLERLGILVDGNTSGGYLLQIFTENLVGPFFYEVIQRKGDNGFGEGNFKALFEAIERDQERRGVL